MSDIMKRLSELGDRQADLEAAADLATAELKRINVALAEVVERELPDLMLEAGMEEFTTTAGHKVAIVRGLTAGLTGKYRAPALAWLRETGNDAIISRDVGTSFGKGEDEAADRAVSILRDAGIDVTDVENVNTSTFKALVKEMLGDGEDVPLEDLGVHQWVKSKITS